MRNKRVWFWGLMIVVVVLLNLPPPAAFRTAAVFRDSVEPFQNTLSMMLRRTRVVFARLGNTAQLMREQQDLEVKVAQLQQRVRELQHHETENAELRRQLGFSILSTQRLQLAEVIARGDISGWWQTIRINKGRRDGVLPGLAVMTTEGVIGRTMEVSDRTSDILLITDPNCKVAVKIPRNDAYGVLRGSGVQQGNRQTMEMLAAVRPAELLYLPVTHEIEVGDEVVTSGLGHIYPEGLSVGRVTSVRLHESGLYRQADVVPTARIRSLRYVFVVME